MKELPEVLSVESSNTVQVLILIWNQVQFSQVQQSLMVILILTMM